MTIKSKKKKKIVVTKMPTPLESPAKPQAGVPGFPSPQTIPFSWQMGLAIGLLLVTLVTYLPVTGYDFVNYDDNKYVYENPMVAAGLSWSGMKWAFTTIHASNWHPVTWVSHMVDTELFGLKAGGHHLGNLVLHLLNTALLLMLLWRMTGDWWPSLLVAALFALHPLHVESVAWVAERKDVLSTFFALLTVRAYLGYVRKPGWASYVWVVVFYALGLMSKPMLVTWPMVLLLLDYWPLGRLHLAGQEQPGNPAWSLRPFNSLVLEKIPLLALAVASCLVTFLAQEQGGAVTNLERLPLDVRGANAVLAYGLYLAKTFWPVDLAVLYPHPKAVLPLATLVVAAVLAAISAGVLWAGRRLPFLVTGWLWYLGTLVPVIGLVQVGRQAMADRYTYIPLIGVFIMLAWGTSRVTRVRPNIQPLLTGLWGAALVSLALMTYQQLGFWKSTFSLWERATQVTADNDWAHYNVANALGRQKDWDGAARHYQAAIKASPSFVDAYINFGLLRLNQGKFDEAARPLEEALRLEPRNVGALNNLGIIRQRQGRLDEAVEFFSAARRLKPDDPGSINNLATTLWNQGKRNEAIELFETALRLKPDADGYANLGNALWAVGRIPEAVQALEQALRLNPQHQAAKSSLVRLKQQMN